jgi:hypothetical protein
MERAEKVLVAAAHGPRDNVARPPCTSTTTARVGRCKVRHQIQHAIGSEKPGWRQMNVASKLTERTL